MESFEIKLDDKTAKSLQNVSPEVRARLEKSFKKQIDELIRQSKLKSFDELLKSISQQAEAKGLTEEFLQGILNEN